MVRMFVIKGYSLYVFSVDGFHTQVVRKLLTVEPGHGGDLAEDSDKDGRASSERVENGEYIDPSLKKCVNI